MNIEGTYRRQTPTSAQLIDRAAEAMPGGSTRSSFWHLPYPLVFRRGSGPRIWDVDGNDYIDFVNNGLSLIHGHCYEPVQKAIELALERGTAWPSASEEQIRFAELLRYRVPNGELVRFTNSGTEAAMLAVKLARFVTGRPLVLKAYGGYHGTYDDLEAGLGTRGPVPGRVELAHFGDADDFARAIVRAGDRLACVILESVMYAGAVVLPPHGFLQSVREMAASAGALFVLDDCLMFRLAEGGSQERFGVDADLTVLGKFLGGGLPVGAVVGQHASMHVLNPNEQACLPHGGSFNGNLLGMTAGAVAMNDFTGPTIEAMDGLATVLRDGFEKIATDYGTPFCTSGVGSIFGIYCSEHPPATPAPREGSWHSLHLSLLNNGLYIGAQGEVSMSTVMTAELVDDALERFEKAYRQYVRYAGGARRLV